MEQLSLELPPEEFVSNGALFTLAKRSDSPTNRAPPIDPKLAAGKQHQLPVFTSERRPTASTSPSCSSSALGQSVARRAPRRTAKGASERALN